MMQILLQAYKVADMLVASENYLKLAQLNELIEQKYQNEINDFNQAKENFAIVKEQGGSHHPDFKDSALKLSNAKSNLYSKEEVKEIIRLEGLIQDELNKIIRTCAGLISPNINTANEVGLIKEKGSCHEGSKNGVCR